MDVEHAPMERLPAIPREAGAAFLFGAAASSVDVHVAGPRVELGDADGFELLGPLADPARVRRQLTGVFDPAWAQPMAETLGRLGSEAAWIVHGQGLDELTVASEKLAAALEAAAWRRFCAVPEAGSFGTLSRAPIEAYPSGPASAATNAAALLGVLGGAAGAYRDTVLLNAAAALVVAGRVVGLGEGVSVGGGHRERGGAPKRWGGCSGRVLSGRRCSAGNKAAPGRGRTTAQRDHLPQAPRGLPGRLWR